MGTLVLLLIRKYIEQLLTVTPAELERMFPRNARKILLACDQTSDILSRPRPLVDEIAKPEVRGVRKTVALERIRQIEFGRPVCIQPWSGRVVIVVFTRTGSHSLHEKGR